MVWKVSAQNWEAFCWVTSCWFYWCLNGRGWISRKKNSGAFRARQGVQPVDFWNPLSKEDIFNLHFQSFPNDKIYYKFYSCNISQKLRKMHPLFLKFMDPQVGGLETSIEDLRARLEDSKDVIGSWSQRISNGESWCEAYENRETRLHFWDFFCLIYICF